ncbi:hypothetical protein CAEBREN_22207 [Caenorhabditis brenneri]|uniref:Uncharacterized protein n=1 Tax=Caenorhabditis brenneri TaxID=135651 RepID=G0MZA6_CAEBE|nr:hypothetical protein CAEBREN_22207 [Caenorhabditis brenneri]
MIFFLPPSFPLVPKSSVSPADLKKQRYIRKLAIFLRDEVTDFIEQKIYLDDKERPNYPTYFIKCFNVLKREAEEINYVDDFLNFLPNAIEMSLLTEFGPSGNSPKFDSNGYLKDTKLSIDEELENCYDDFIDLIFHSFLDSEKFRDLPMCFFLMIKHFEHRIATEETTDLERTKVSLMAKKMQFRCGMTMASHCPKDYVERCTQRYEMMIRNL